MTEPSWRQLAAISDSLQKYQIMNACGVELEVNGVSRVFIAGQQQIYASDLPSHGGAVRFTLYPAPGSRSFESPKELLKALRWPQGTPTGDALRKWLGFYGWKPKQ